MKKISVKKEIISIIVIIAILFGMANTVLATLPPIQVTIPGENTSTNSNTDNSVNVNPAISTNTSSNYQNNTALPQTGDASDYAIFGLIVVSVAIAVYAYKKVRDYNI